MGPGTEVEVYAESFWERTVQGGKTVWKARQELAMVTLDRHCGSDECGQTLETRENERMNGHLPGGPGVKNLPANAGAMGSIPGWDSKIPHALGQLSLRRNL